MDLHQDSRIQVLSKHTKGELIWMATRRCCAHGKPYIQHLPCYAAEVKQDEETVGYLDIEASNLNANFGIILSYCIKEKDGRILHGLISPSQLRSKAQDKEVVRKCIIDIMKFDRVVTYYGTKFDIPYIRSRAMAHGMAFPERGLLLHTDVYYWVKHKLKLHSNRMQHACDFLGIKAKEHPLHGGMWTRALVGDTDALKYILVHNREDVESLEKLHKLLGRYNSTTKSII